MRKKVIKNKTVFVAMSGGVDSSVAALLLKNEGYNVVGVFMRCFSAEGGFAFGENVDGCQQEKDAEDARRVAEKLGIPFYVWDFEDEYKKKVVKYMVDGYRNGITPNPDVMCNREIKFGLFFDRAMALGADYVATGHYVQLRRKFPISNPSEWTIVRADFQFPNKSKIRSSQKLKIENYRSELKIARDLNKDQSYFLWTLTQKQLAHCLFPIGDYLKPEIREIARKAGLPTANKKDSQGICFLGVVSIADFLKEYIRPKRGAILTISGAKIGEHEGAYFYTIGQRHGLDLKSKNYELGITGEHKTLPHYVAEKDVKTNTLVVAEGKNNKALYKKEVELANVNFINPDFTGLIRANRRIRNHGLKVLARVRYRQPLVPARLVTSYKRQETEKRKNETNHLSLVACHWSLKFDAPVKFVAPGQSAVFYTREGEILGGGVII